MAKTKILIHVRGGCVTTVMSSDPNVEVELFDIDNMQEGKEESPEPEETTTEEAYDDVDALWAEKSKGMTEVW